MDFYKFSSLEAQKDHWKTVSTWLFMAFFEEQGLKMVNEKVH